MVNIYGKCAGIYSNVNIFLSENTFFLGMCATKELLRKLLFRNFQISYSVICQALVFAVTVVYVSFLFPLFFLESDVPLVVHTPHMRPQQHNVSADRILCISKKKIFLFQVVNHPILTRTGPHPTPNRYHELVNREEWKKYFANPHTDKMYRRTASQYVCLLGSCQDKCFSF